MAKNINESINLDELVVTPKGASFSSNKTGVQPTTTKYWRIKVKPGDNLTKLANQYNTTVDELVKINNLKDPNSIYAGLDLRVVSREKENKNYASDYTQAVKNIADVRKIDTRHAAALLDELISQGTVKFDGTPQFIMPSKASTASKVQKYKTKEAKEARERDTRSKDFNFTKTYVANQNAAWKRNPEVMQAFKDAGDATGYGAASLLAVPTVVSTVAPYAISAYNTLAKPTEMILGGAGLYDSVSDMSENGITLSNSIQAIGSALPFLKYTKFGNWIDDAFSNTRFGQYFNKDAIRETADQLASTQKQNPVDIKTRLKLLFRFRTPDAVKAAGNIAQDMAAGTTANHLTQPAIDTVNDTWDYNYDENGNVKEDLNYNLKNKTISALNTLGFTFGMGTRSGNSARNLFTSTLAFGPGSDMINDGLNYVEDKFNLSDNQIWDKTKKATQIVTPVLIQRGIDRGITAGKQKLNKDLNLNDQRILATTNSDVVKDVLIEEGTGLPIAHMLSTILPDNLQDEGTVAQLASIIGGRMNHKDFIAKGLGSTAGAQQYDQKTVARTSEALAAGDLTKFHYTGSYENNDSYMLGSTQQGSIFGVEGANKNKKGKGAFNRYDQSLGRNFAQSRQEMYDPNWWNIHTGSYIPTIGEAFNLDSKIVRYDNDYKSRNDYASVLAHSDNDGRHLAEIRTNSKILGDSDVPQDVHHALVYGINRSDKYFTGPNNSALNTVGANGVIYADNQGTLKGIQIVDYTNPGVRRITPTNTVRGKVAYTLAHPMKVLKNPKLLTEDFSKKDNYYNKSGSETPSTSHDIKYLLTSWATSAAEGLQRNKVFSTTGYKAFSDITKDEYKNGKIRELLFNPNKQDFKSPNITEIKKFYKGTDLESAPFGVQLENYINEINKFEGKTLGEKYRNFSNYMNSINQVITKKKEPKKRYSKKQEERREAIETQMELWLSQNSSNLYTKKGNIKEGQFEKLFKKNKPVEIKESYYLGLPEDIRNFIDANYQYTLYKKGGKL